MSIYRLYELVYILLYYALFQSSLWLPDFNKLLVLFLSCPRGSLRTRTFLEDNNIAGMQDTFDWFHGLTDHLTFYSPQRLDLFAWCVRLSRLLVGFRTHFKSSHFLLLLLLLEMSFWHCPSARAVSGCSADDCMHCEATWFSPTLRLKLYVIAGIAHHIYTSGSQGHKPY